MICLIANIDSEYNILLLCLVDSGGTGLSVNRMSNGLYVFRNFDDAEFVLDILSMNHI